MSTAVANGMQRLRVTLNYNGNEQKFFDIPSNWNNKEIKDWVTKKFGIYDVKDFVIINPETIENNG